MTTPATSPAPLPAFTLRRAATGRLELTDAAYLSAWLGEQLTLPLDAERFEEELQKHSQEEQANG